MTDVVKGWVFRVFGVRIFTIVFGHPCSRRNCTMHDACMAADNGCLNINEQNKEA